MSERPFLSVVIPTHDAPELLEGALRSLGEQDFPARNVEIVVVDDGSPRFDPAGWDDLAGPFRLVLIRKEENSGRGRARNEGIRAARGDVVLFLDGDMTAAPGFLRAHAEFHRTHPGEVGVGNIRFGSQIPTTALTQYLDSRGVQRYRSGETVPFKCFVTGNSSVSRQTLLDVGLFDEDFHAYGGEDLELGYRLHRRQIAFRFAGDALSHHHHLRPLEQTCQLMHTYGSQSLPILLRKHPELAPLLRLDFLTSRQISARALRLALGDWVYRITLGVVKRRLDKSLPSVLFDYLWWHNRTRGYLLAQSKCGGPPSARREHSAC